MLLLLSACGGATQAEGATRATVRGTVVAAPGCPVERLPSACPARPVEGAHVTAIEGGVPVADTRSGPDGSFALHVPVGSCTLSVVDQQGLGGTVRKVVQVPPAGVEDLVITLDSGIR